MENCGEFCDSYSQKSTTSRPSSEACSTILRAADSVRPICDRPKSDKLRKISDNQKYRSACLKRYVYAGVKHCRRRPKKTFVVPVIHVLRRPDNPFDVKNVVENLKKAQMTNKISEANQQLPKGHQEEEFCYSNLEKRITKAKNWETIRYKYQLDYKEKLKMEREKYLKDYAEKRKMAQQHQREENIRTIYQNMEDRVKEVSRNANVTKDQLIERSAQKNSHQHLAQSQQFANISSDRHPQAFSGRSENSEESINYYHTDVGRSNGCDLVDLTKDYENRRSSPRNEVTQLRLVRNERRNSRSQFNRNQMVNDSDALSMPENVEQEMMARKSQRDDFDFSIPFNESKILIKVMTPEGRNPIKVITQPILQETLSQYATGQQPKQEENAPNRVAFDVEPKANMPRVEPPSGNQWLQYIQNILNKTTDPQPDPVNNKKVSFNHSKPNGKSIDTNDPIPRHYVDPRPIPIPATNRKPTVVKVNTAVAAIPHTANYYDHSLAPSFKPDRPVVSNPRLVRPKVMHPSPYFRSDSLRSNPQYNDKLEDPIGVAQMVPHHPSAAQMPAEQSNVPQHNMDYLYGNHPNFHHHDYNMVRNRRLPLDIPHPSLIGQPIYSSYDQNYMQYRSEMERIPQPCLDPYIQHNMHGPPFNPSIGYFTPRPPAALGMYRYLNPQHHPVWIYPHNH